MKVSPLQAVLASVAIVGAAGLAHVAVPRELMAISSESFDLQQVVPRQFGETGDAVGCHHGVLLCWRRLDAMDHGTTAAGLTPI